MSLKLVQHNSEFYSPAEWDTMIHTQNATELLATIDPTLSELHGRRFIQAAAATLDDTLLLDALDRVGELWPGKMPGTRHWALMALKRYDEVLASSPVRPTSTDHLVLEDACDAEAARATSAAERRDYPMALAHVYAGQLLAGSLGMSYRTQWMRLEMGRILAIMGRPDSQLLREAMSMLPMSERRNAWSTRTLAEAMVGEGDLHGALILLRDRPEDDFAQFVAALLNVPVDESKLQAAGGNYGDLARAVREARAGRYGYTIAPKRHQPQAGYATLLRVLAMLRSGQMPAQTVRALLQSRDELAAPDQRILRQVLLLGGLSSTHEAAAIMDEIQDLNASLDKMHDPQHVLAWLRSIAPEQFALAALCPGVHVEVVRGLRDVALLLGEHITFSSVTFKVPGKAAGGLAMVQAAYRGEPVVIHRQQRKRFSEAMQLEFGGEPPHIVNLGSLLRQLAAFRAVAPRQQTHQWDAAVRNAVEMIDSRSLKREILNDLKL